MDCPICANTFNKGNRTLIKCFACDLAICKECMRTYLTTNIKLPKCMNCNVRFSTNFLVRKLNRSWVVNTYKETLIQVLTEQEMGKLPETQPYVEAEIETQRLMTQNMQYMREMNELTTKVRKLKVAIQANQFLIRGETIPVNLMQQNEYVTTNTPVSINTRKQFVMSCPLDCRGFLSTQYKCGTCQKSICSDCLCLKEDEHVCIESNKLSAELIKRDSKPCPKCGTRICKIDGCDQMYCTSQRDGIHCNTAFSWRTGTIETGTVHNPHYYELMNKMGVQLRNAGDVQCGGMPEIRKIVRAFESLRKIPIYQDLNLSDLRASLVRIHRRLTEMVQYITNDFRRRVLSHETNMRRLRVRYMMKTVNKDIFASSIYKLEHEYQKNVDLQHILELVSISGIETFRGIIQDFPELNEREWITIETGFIEEVVGAIKDRLKQLHSVREYCNDQLREVSITYHCTVDIMDEIFTHIPVKYNINGQKKHKSTTE